MALGRKEIDAFQYPDLWEMSGVGEDTVRLRLKDGYVFEVAELNFGSSFRLKVVGSELKLQKLSGGTWSDLEVW